jgi:6-phosphogluconolactonase (cycloisomerase 2 family)
VSPDGKHVYATATNDLSVAWFGRDSITGDLTYGGVVKNGQGGVSGLYEPHSIALSRDGRHCYVTGAIDDALVWFTRNPADGSLSFGSSLQDGISGVDGLDGAYSVCVSGNGRFVYAAAVLDHSVTKFSRDTATGVLIYENSVKSGMPGVLGMRGPACVTTSPDGKFVYTASATSDALVRLGLDTLTGALTWRAFFQDSVATNSTGGDPYGINGAYSAAVSPDNNTIYVAARWSSSLTWFSRDSADSMIFGGTIKAISGLGDAKWVALSPDGRHVYVAATGDNAVSWFEVVPSGVITQYPGKSENSFFSVTMRRNGRYAIAYNLHKGYPGWVTLGIATLQGRMIRELYSGTEGAGTHLHEWDLRTDAGLHVSPGIYLCVLRAGRLAP